MTTVKSYDIPIDIIPNRTISNSRWPTRAHIHATQVRSLYAIWHIYVTCLVAIHICFMCLKKKTPKASH